MNSRLPKGFTLLELLLVIGIIALLSVIVVIGLADARAKSRDAKRLSDMVFIAKALELHTTNVGPVSIEDCNQGSATLACKTTGALHWELYLDPAGSSGCRNTSSNSCQYVIGRANPRSDDYEICFVTEREGILGPRGVYKRTNSGFSMGCSYQ